jgi:hypothetical protein
MFDNYTASTFQYNLGPKVQGTWNLHNLLPSDLDFFVLLSSTAGVLGAVSQSAYSAAGSFLDAFARFRRSRGQACVSLDMGIVDRVGYIADHVDVAQAMSMAYISHKVLRESDVHFMVKYACSRSSSGSRSLHGTTPSSSSSGKEEDGTISSAWRRAQLIGAMSTPAFVQRGGIVSDQSWMRVPMFRHLYRMELSSISSTTTSSSSSSAATAAEQSIGSRLQAAATFAEAVETVTTALVRHIARSLAVPPVDIDVHRPPHVYGVDSLVAVELLFWLNNEIRAEVPVIQILGSQTIAELGILAARKSDFVSWTE